MPFQRCLFCGGDASEPDHLKKCDGRQGRVDAKEPPEPVLRARTSDPTTSHAAMARMNREQFASATELAAKIHRAHPRGLADFEYKPLFMRAWAKPCSEHLYRQARSAARDRGLIRETVNERLNPASNRQQVVWEYCEDVPPTIQRCVTCGHVLRRQAG
jgi:hypothetical protein